MLGLVTSPSPLNKENRSRTTARSGQNKGRVLLTLWSFAKEMPALMPTADIGCTFIYFGQYVDNYKQSYLGFVVRRRLINFILSSNSNTECEFQFTKNLRRTEYLFATY
jgi:hypothetical protein